MTDFSRQSSPKLLDVPGPQCWVWGVMSLALTKLCLPCSEMAQSRDVEMGSSSACGVAPEENMPSMGDGGERGGCFFSFLLGRRGELIEKGRKVEGKEKQEKKTRKQTVPHATDTQSSSFQSWLPPGSLRCRRQGPTPSEAEGLISQGCSRASSEFLNLPSNAQVQPGLRATGQGLGSESSWTRTW